VVKWWRSALQDTPRNIMNTKDTYESMEVGSHIQVMQDTFGHLRTKPDERHQGFVIFAVGEGGERIVLKDGFDDVDGSPWFHSEMQELIWNDLYTSPGVYKFVGFYETDSENNGKFVGQATEIDIS